MVPEPADNYGKINTFTKETPRMAKTEKQKMLAGEFYTAVDDELQADQAAARHWMERYNRSIGLTRSEERRVGKECPV